jgi:hypothetical protein
LRHYWWLRSPGYYAGYAAIVDGNVFDHGGYVGNAYGGVRPALWLSL